ncbi:MAG TPA: adenylate/guanylate cyclase domain-containing protein [Dehalococcoidia bacterium]|nr:adenylate/guanylate cyclase domain-containing protein [Dehalococcoidia bacterium]
MSGGRSAPITTAELTIMFTDLVGFTEFIADHGDAVVLDLLATQERLVRESLPPRARIVKELGDGLMLSFDDPCDAVATGLTLQSRFEEEAATSDFPLWVRIGVHSGRPVPRRDDLVGNDVNIAARIVDLAAPGEVIASEATRRQAADRLPGVVFEPLGPAVMKGIPSPIPIFRALREGS